MKYFTFLGQSNQNTHIYVIQTQVTGLDDNSLGRPPSIDVTACVRRAKRQKLIFHRVTGTVSAIAVWYHDKYVDEDANQDYGLL